MLDLRGGSCGQCASETAQEEHSTGESVKTGAGELTGSSRRGGLGRRACDEAGMERISCETD